MSEQSLIKVVVAQKGSREHFAIARALHRQRLLALLVADWYAPRSPFARLLVNCFPRRIARRALAAEAPELPPDLVHSLNGLGLWRRIPEAWSRKRGRPYDGYATSGAMFARKVSSMPLPPHDVFFGYSYDSLDVLEAERIPEAIKDNISGLLVSRDSASLVNAILRLYDRPTEQARLGYEGRRLFLQTFEMNQILHQYHSLYLQSLQEPRLSPVPEIHGTQRRPAALCD